MTREQEYNQLNDLIQVVKKYPFSRNPDLSEVALSEAIYQRSKAVNAYVDKDDCITLKSRMNDRNPLNKFPSK